MQTNQEQTATGTSRELSAFTLGIVDERMIILAGIEKLMTSRDMELIETAEEFAV